MSVCTFPRYLRKTANAIERRGRQLAGRRLVLRHDAGGNASAVADRDALGLRPGADLTAALASGRRTGRSTAGPPPCLARVLHEWLQARAECPGVLPAEVELVLRAADPEPHCLLRRAAIKIIY